MKVELVWITPGADALIAKIARVSSPNQDNPEYAKLIRYLIKNKHWSPFEMASACFEIETSRAISQQITRHRSFSYQEFSQRYAKATGAEYVQIRRGGTTNRQSSALDPALAKKWGDVADRMLADNFRLYNAMLEDGVATESARFVLPLATTTRIYMAGTVRSWVHYLDLRCDPHTQEEHREIALEIRKQLTPHIPTVAEALEW